MNKSDAQAAFEGMSKAQQDKVRKWHQKNPGMRWEQAVAEFAVKPLPSGHPDEAIAPNTVAGKLRNRKVGRR
jgi:hypothetical protein